MADCADGFRLLFFPSHHLLFAAVYTSGRAWRMARPLFVWLKARVALGAVDLLFSPFCGHWHLLFSTPLPLFPYASLVVCRLRNQFPFWKQAAHLFLPERGSICGNRRF